VHDARLVALMMVHGVRQIVTFNAADFTRYAGIDVVRPDTIG
jgi:predicted nucleic acid-binding protein